MNVSDEVPQSYLHQRNPELDQTRYTIETKDHEYVDLDIYIYYFQEYMPFVRKKDIQSWIVFLCLFTSE